ncbi:MAG: 50S ribosomal protein L6 [Acidimicrobiaceae bacterium]|nr:50S ribosomal protein L6 [Acidimicrobiaceae bacterium]MCY4175524.1 50S ribosomal protein L6 [Acidimicrobiaceae bacterium]MCY4279207.1 50S ribosomal protein L6 [Acidimicrobiaceae bacterium]MCY4293907.1 50S ribosomal protein L6 [Acidimicrobiaceae bacterium]
MSRVGNAPIPLPSGVAVTVEGGTVVVTGAKGTLRHRMPAEMSLSNDGGAVRVERPDDTASSRSLHGLTRSLVANMVKGVSEGFSKELRIQGVGYRVAEFTDTSLELALGFSHPVHVRAPEGIEFEVPQRTQIVVKGIDKQLVGQVASDIRKWRPPEPYKGKGIRYVDERVKRKAGKAAK